MDVVLQSYSKGQIDVLVHCAFGEQACYVRDSMDIHVLNDSIIHGNF